MQEKYELVTHINLNVNYNKKKITLITKKYSALTSSASNFYKIFRPRR